MNAALQAGLLLVLALGLATGCRKKDAPSSPAVPVPAKEAGLPATSPDLSGAKSVDDFVFGWLKHLGVEPSAP